MPVREPAVRPVYGGKWADLVHPDCSKSLARRLLQIRHKTARYISGYKKARLRKPGFGE
jgi:hypothetical protein